MTSFYVGTEFQRLAVTVAKQSGGWAVQHHPEGDLDEHNWITAFGVADFDHACQVARSIAEALDL